MIDLAIIVVGVLSVVLVTVGVGTLNDQTYKKVYESVLEALKKPYKAIYSIQERKKEVDNALVEQIETPEGESAFGSYHPKTGAINIAKKIRNKFGWTETTEVERHATIEHEKGHKKTTDENEATITAINSLLDKGDITAAHQLTKYALETPQYSDKYSGITLIEYYHAAKSAIEEAISNYSGLMRNYKEKIVAAIPSYKPDVEAIMTTLEPGKYHTKRA